MTTGRGNLMADNIFDVSGTNVIISGASRGIGEAIAAGFAARDANVIITGRDAKTLAETADRINVGAGTVQGIVCDIADEAAINACVDQAIDDRGRIDTLVNCAGVNIRKPVEDYSSAEFDFIFNINLRGSFLMSQKVGKQMIAQKSGAQINIDSLATNAPLHLVTPYSMGKSALSAMTRGLAAEWGPHGIRVNGLAPGFILTDLTAGLWSNENMKNWNNVVAPLRRLGAPDDMVGTALFLASDAAAFMTGQILRVDGGVSAGLRWPIDDGFQAAET